MKRLCRSDLHRILTGPIDKKIDQSSVEKWSASLWKLHKNNEKSDNKKFPLSHHHKNNDNHKHDLKPFVMMLPPPNITGNLHLGHALTLAIEDALIRHRSMLGKQSIWVPGFDHAGISTQMIVEKLLWNKQKLTRQQYGREKFIDLAHEWKDLKRNEMREQIDRLGHSLDYDKEFFTLDEKSSLAVRDAFKQLFELGLIYRSVKPVFWSQEMQTTLSDIEVEKDSNGTNRYVRTGEIVDRRDLSQWFVNARDIAERAVKVVQDKSIEMIPDNYKRSWSSWLLETGVEDWCISRQNWWGHRIPAYRLESSEDSTENWVVADNLNEAKQKFDFMNITDNVIQDQDVLDTWFSSSLLPLTISDWPNMEKFNKNIELNFFPLTIMETGFDILTYWVSKMVMMSLALTNEIPFKLILLHGMICDSHGKKMSKSKGNVIDPLDVIDGASLENLQEKSKIANNQGIIENSQLEFVLENQKKLFPNGIPKCGADGLRAYLLSLDIQEEIVKVQIMQIDKIRRFSNKVWNIYRFVIGILENTNVKDININLNLSDIEEKNNFDFDDINLLKELGNCVKISQKSFIESYQLQHCFINLELFLTQSLSSTFIANNKLILFNSMDPKHKLKLQLLIKCLVTATKILHPFMPHLTEFLYQKLYITTSGKQNSNLELIDSLKLLVNQDFPSVEGEWFEYSNNNKSE